MNTPLKNCLKETCIRRKVPIAEDHKMLQLVSNFCGDESKETFCTCVTTFSACIKEC